MTAVSLTCGLCGQTDHVPVDAVLASVNVEGIDDHDHAGCLSWTCSGCRQMVTAMVAWHPLLILLTAGVRLLDDDPDEDWLPGRPVGSTDRGSGDGLFEEQEQLSGLPPHPERPGDGAVFTPDDLLTLHELLAADNWFAQLRTCRSV